MFRQISRETKSDWTISICTWSTVFLRMRKERWGFSFKQCWVSSMSTVQNILSYVQTVLVKFRWYVFTLFQRPKAKNYFHKKLHVDAQLDSKYASVFLEACLGPYQTFVMEFFLKISSWQASGYPTTCFGA